MRAAVDLQHASFLRTALPATAVFRRPPLPRALQPCCSQGTAHCRPTESNSLLLGKHLSEVLRIEASIRGTGKFDNTPPYPVIQGMPGLPTPVAVGQRCCPIHTVPRQESPHLPHRQPQDIRRLPPPQPSPPHPV